MTETIRLWSRRAAALLVLVAILVSLSVAVQRMQAEREYNTVNIIVNETDVRSFANANHTDVKDMLETLKEHGVSQILFKETSLADLENEGKIGIYQGQNVYDARNAHLLPDLLVSDASRYVVIYDETWREQIAREVQVKVRNVRHYEHPGEGYDVLEVPSMIAQTPQETQAAKQVVDVVGVGYDRAFMQTVADVGMGVIPQVRTWRAVDDPSFKLLKEDLRAVPNLSMVMMNDKMVPGFPDQLDQMAAVLSDGEGKALAPLGIVEFTRQQGIEKLGMKLNKEVVRIHTISNAEMSQFEGDTEAERALGERAALDRWILAARERNMRGLLVRFFEISEPAYSLEVNLNYLDNLKDSLEEKGFTLGKPYAAMTSVEVAPWQHFLIGAGVCAGLFLLLESLGFLKLGMAFALCLLLGWAGALHLSPEMARKMMALLCVMIFPTYSCIRFLNVERKTLPRAVLQLLLMCAVSFIAAMLMVGLLSGNLFMLKLDQFVGVKMAHIVPIVLVPVALFIWLTDDPLETVEELLKKTLDYKWAILFGVLFVALTIYVSRTGNTGAQISDTEMGMRQWLTDAFGVRPRSKEFLIGYPLTLLYFIYGARKKAFWILSIPAVIAQVSLVNTYAHIHTPLVISLMRSLNGLILGVAIGVLLALALYLLGKILPKCYAYYHKRRLPQ